MVLYLGGVLKKQLLQHYSDVFEALLEDTMIDIIYLHFPKAFNKVNYHILVKKSVKPQNNGENSKMDRELPI